MPRSFLITNKRYKADYIHGVEDVEAFKENSVVLGNSISVVVTHVNHLHHVHPHPMQQQPMDLRRDTDTDDSLSAASLPSPSSSGDESFSDEAMDSSSPTSPKLPSPLHQFAMIAAERNELCNYLSAASLGHPHHHHSHLHHIPSHSPPQTHPYDYKLRLSELGSPVGVGGQPTSHHGVHPDPDSPAIKHLDYNLNELVDKAWDDVDCGENHNCPDCGKRYSTSSNLARHRQTHRSVSDKKARKCPHCEKVYVSMPAYSMHVRTHNQGCECNFCGKRFSRPWLLQGHIRTHTGEKPFKCPTCNKSFADKSNLRAHVQTHSADKPYTCGRCGKAFALKSYLYKHEESSCMRGQRFTRNH